jgi:hypothetical protein
MELMSSNASTGTTTQSNQLYEEEVVEQEIIDVPFSFAPLPPKPVSEMSSQLKSNNDLYYHDIDL